MAYFGAVFIVKFNLFISSNALKIHMECIVRGDANIVTSCQ